MIMASDKRCKGIIASSIGSRLTEMLMIMGKHPDSEVSALCSLLYFVTVGWVKEGLPDLEDFCHQVFKGSLTEQLEEEK